MIAKLNIISVFKPNDRIEEYVNKGFNLPRLDDGSIDCWKLAVELCKLDGGHLMTEGEMDKLVRGIYKNHKLNKTKIPPALSGLGSSWYLLWSSSENSAYNAYGRYFRSSGTNRFYYTRYSSSIRAVCVGDNDNNIKEDK